MRSNHRLYPYLALVTALLFWGFSFILTKIALAELSPSSLVFFRFSLSAIIFIGLLAYRGFPRFSRSEHFKIFLVALFQPFLYFLFETNGLQYTTASKASLLIATIPIFVLLLSVTFLKEKAGLPHLGGILLSITGAFILIAGDPGFSQQITEVMLGDGLILGAVFSGALYTVLVRYLANRFTPLELTGYQVIWGALLFTPDFIMKFPSENWDGVTLPVILSVLGLSLFATIGAFLCYNYALSKIEAVKASIFINGIPVVTAIGAWAILGERLLPQQLFGGLIILAGVYMANLNFNRKGPLSNSTEISPVNPGDSKKAADFQTPGYEEMELSTQILIKEALHRDLKVEVLDREDNLIRVTNEHQQQIIKQATRTTADHYIAPLVMENKQVTKLLLSEKGINTPAGFSFSSHASALAQFDKIHKHAMVVKPNRTNFGKGITILNANFSLEQYQEALEVAFKFDDTVLVETFYPGEEYRFLIIGDRVIGILKRIAANVKGDGHHTIGQLIDLKNEDPLRGKGYKTPLEKIVKGEPEASFLGEQGKTFETIPELDEVVFLRKNSNISTGGDSIDCTDIIPDAYKEISLDAVKAVEAKICGVDMIIKDLGAPPLEVNHAILELNFNPAIHIHNFPYNGENRRAEKAILDLLGF